MRSRQNARSGPASRPADPPEPADTPEAAPLRPAAAESVPSLEELRSQSAPAMNHAHAGSPNPMEDTGDLPLDGDATVRSAATDAGAADDPPHHTLIWPPPEDALAGWEIVQLEGTGQTIIQSGPPSSSAAPDAGPPAAAGRGLDADQDTYRPAKARLQAPAPRPVTPAILSDPDRHLPETQLIEPLSGESLLAPHALAPRPPAPRPKPGPPQTARPAKAPAIIVTPTELGGLMSPAGRDQTRPRVVVQPAGMPLATRSSALDHAAADETVDPTAQTRIIPIPPGLLRARGLPSVPPADLATAQTVDEDITTKVRLSPLANPELTAATVDPLTPDFSFRPVEADAAQLPPAARTVPRWRIALAIIIVLAIAQIAYLFVKTLQPAAAPPLTGTLVVESTPTGAEVLIDGESRGKTPFKMDVDAGEHALEVRSGDQSRTRTITLNAGTLASFNLELPSAAPTVAAIEVRSEPSGARVSIGGVDRGRTPVVVSGLAPGRHLVRVSGSSFRTVTRRVTLAAGQHALVVVTPVPSSSEEEREGGADGADSTPAAPAAAPAAAGARPPAPDSSAPAPAPRTAPAAPGRGWLTVNSPLVLRVMRNGDFLGTSEDARIPLPAGSHTISLENESVNFRDVRTVDVTANRAVTVPVALPQGTLNINAQPWAEVFVDGQHVGQTPVAQLALPIGAHEVVFRHPQYAERRVTVVVKVGAPGRTFTDFTK